MKLCFGILLLVITSNVNIQARPATKATWRDLPSVQPRQDENSDYYQVHKSNIKLPPVITATDDSEKISRHDLAISDIKKLTEANKERDAVLEGTRSDEGNEHASDQISNGNVQFIDGVNHKSQVTNEDAPTSMKFDVGGQEHFFEKDDKNGQSLVSSEDGDKGSLSDGLEKADELESQKLDLERNDEKLKKRKDYTDGLQYGVHSAHKGGNVMEMQKEREAIVQQKDENEGTIEGYKFKDKMGETEGKEHHDVAENDKSVEDSASHGLVDRNPTKESEDGHGKGKEEHGNLVQDNGIKYEDQDGDEGTAEEAHSIRKPMKENTDVDDVKYEDPKSGEDSARGIDSIREPIKKTYFDDPKRDSTKEDHSFREPFRGNTYAVDFQTEIKEGRGKEIDFPNESNDGSENLQEKRVYHKSEAEGTDKESGNNEDKKNTARNEKKNNSFHGFTQNVDNLQNKMFYLDNEKVEEKSSSDRVVIETNSKYSKENDSDITADKVNKLDEMELVDYSDTSEGGDDVKTDETTHSIETKYETPESEEQIDGSEFTTNNYDGQEVSMGAGRNGETDEHYDEEERFLQNELDYHGSHGTELDATNTDVDSEDDFAGNTFGSEKSDNFEANKYSDFDVYGDESQEGEYDSQIDDADLNDYLDSIVDGDGFGLSGSLKAEMLRDERNFWKRAQREKEKKIAYVGDAGFPEHYKKFLRYGFSKDYNKQTTDKADAEENQSEEDVDRRYFNTFY